jgi:hypothetical protein
MPHFKISCIVPYIPTKAIRMWWPGKCVTPDESQETVSTPGYVNCWQFIYNSEVKQFMLWIYNDLKWQHFFVAVGWFIVPWGMVWLTFLAFCPSWKGHKIHSDASWVYHIQHFQQSLLCVAKIWKDHKHPHFYRTFTADILEEGSRSPAKRTLSAFLIRCHIQMTS